MRYADTLLSDGEVIVLRKRQHWLSILVEGRLGVLLWVVALALLIAVWFFDLQGQTGQLVGLAALGCLLLGVLIVGLRYWQWWAQDYLITNRRLMKVTGIFNKDASSNSLEHINDAVLHQNVLGRILNYGNVDILTASGELARDFFHMLQGAKEFKRVLTSQKHALEMDYRYDQTPSPPLRTRMNMNGEPAGAPPPPAPPPPPGPSSLEPSSPEPGGRAAAPEDEDDASLEITQTLARLADLRDRGAISSEEYEVKKGELLRRL